MRKLQRLSFIIALLFIPRPSEVFAAQDAASDNRYHREPIAKIKPPTVIASGFMNPRTLMQDDNGWLIHLSPNQLWRVEEGSEPVLLREDLPEDIQLKQTAVGPIGIQADRLVMLDETLSPIVKKREDIQAVTINGNEVYWVEAPGNGTLYKATIAASSSPSPLANGLGTVNCLGLTGEEILVGIQSSEPRGFHIIPQGALASEPLVESKLLAREVLVVEDGSVYTLMSTGPGFIKTLNADHSLSRLAFAPGGSGELQWADNALFWRSPSAIYRLGLPNGEPVAVAANTQPVSMVVDAANVRIVWLDGARGQLLTLAFDDFGSAD